MIALRLVFTSTRVRCTPVRLFASSRFHSHDIIYYENTNEDFLMQICVHHVLNDFHGV